MPREYEKNPDEIGSLWLKESQRGEYMTGEIDGQKVVCFPIHSKNPKAPTWRVLKSRPRDEAPSRRYEGHEGAREDDDSIPF